MRKTRRKLTANEKTTMQNARTVAKAQKAEATAALAGNSQFTNPKFWEKVEGELVSGIQKAIATAAKTAKSKQIKALESELASLKGE